MTVILLRHGRSTSNTAHTLAGRSEGVDLDDKGREQAQALVARLGALPIQAIVRSPLLRCERTVEPLAAALGLEPMVDERISEVDYGSWTGRKIGDLVKEPLWAVVQQQPSAAVFPGGEGLAQVQARAVAAVREHDRRLAEQHEGDVLWVACTHGDVIKSVVADALGTHLDSFQRITADPASMSVIRYTALRPFVIHVNHTGAALDRRTAGQAAEGRRRGRRTARCRPMTLWSAAPPTDGSPRNYGRRCRYRYFGRCHVPRNSRLPLTRPLRGRDCRAARQPHLLPAGRPRQARGVGDAGEATGGGARRADRRAAAGDQPPLRHPDPARDRRHRRPEPVGHARRRRVPGRAPWVWAGIPRRRRSSSNCSRCPRPSSTRRWCSTTPRTGPTRCGSS